MMVTGTGALGVWHSVAAGQESTIEDWYNREHHAERVAIRGFLRARRYVNLGQGLRYFSRYDVADSGVLRSDGYLAALNNPSSASQRMFPHYRNTERGVFDVLARAGDADGGFIASLRFANLAEGKHEALQAMLPGIAARLAKADGVLRAEAWRVNVEITAHRTEEKKLRATGDAFPTYALLVDASSVERLQEALNTEIPSEVRSIATTDVLQLVFHKLATWN